MIRLFLIISTLLFPLFTFGAPSENIHVRDTAGITVNGTPGDNLATFAGNGWITDFFIKTSLSGNAVENTFVAIAWGIKNFFICIAVIFLIIGVTKLLFSSGDEEAAKKWRRNIIWVSVGIFVMQIWYSVWRTLYLKDTMTHVDGKLGWLFWVNIFEPIVNVMLVLASFAFLAMAIYAFYVMVSAWGNEERVKKGKNIIIYAIIGFLLIRIPKFLVTAIYGTPTDACKNNVWISVGICTVNDRNLADGVNIFWKILTYISGFLALLAVVLVIYAGWLIFISAGEEEKLKKAKNILIYVLIGFVALVASHAIFRFFFLGGMA
jgi:hypothetical protein